jgi:formylglycine-generating enzyme required for sulfatase activity
LDWYRWNYYSESDEFNPTGPFLGQYKVIRGGGFTSSEKGIRVYERSYISPDDYRSDIGFRVARSINLE